LYEAWLTVLKKSQLFRGVSAEALSVMLNCLKPRIRHCKQREVIGVCGQPFHGIGIVAAGSVALTRETASGNRVFLNVLEAGESFGEASVFSGNKVWPATVIAQEDSVLLFLPPGKVAGNCANTCRSHHTLIMNSLGILSRRVETLNQKIEHLSAKSNRQKVAGYLLDLYRRTGKSEIEIPMKRHELADYLGMPRPSLSREMSLMQADGLISFKGHRVNMRNALALEKIIG
jgi:CRP-like cAMP-binding protein